MIQKNCTKA